MESESSKTEISDSVTMNDVLVDNEFGGIKATAEEKSEKVEMQIEPSDNSSDKNLQNAVESQPDKDQVEIQNENKYCAEDQIDPSLSHSQDVETKETHKNPENVTEAIVVADSMNKSSLSLLNQYVSSSEYESDDSDQDNGPTIEKEPVPSKSTQKLAGNEDDDVIVLEKIQQHITSGPYRIASSSSEEESSSSDVEEVTRAELDEFLDEDNATTPKGPIKSIGEMGINDLPPIEDLKITVPEEECVELGKIMSIVEQLVLVDSLPGTVPLNLETVLFLEKGHKALGKVFDVLGNISSPIYCIRFNSNNEIKQKNIKIGEIVFVAPRTEHTSFVILSELMTNKGSDASREDDNENSSESEYSDDEKERNARATKSGKTKTVQYANPTHLNKRQRGRGGNYSSPRNWNSHQHNRGGAGVGRGRGQYHSNYHHSWHSNYQSNSNQMTQSGPLYPNPYAQQFQAHQSGTTMQNPVFPVPSSLFMQPPPPPPSYK